VQDLPREVLEENTFFLLIHVERHAADATEFQRFD
jgi:hypothetical protein